MNNEEKIVEKPVNNQPYTLRPLCDEDLYPILDIIAKVCPDEIRPIFDMVAAKFDDMVKLIDDDVQEDEKQKIIADLANDLGVDVVMQLGLTIIRNVKTVKNEVYALLSDLSGIPAENIRRMPFGTTPKMIMDVAKNAKNHGFFGE
ncbi:MAG: hypothetical protein IJV91_05680 [Kiritimatiellae bacterium]|nr:hypothetical protein [Kiritimatiellia bacterium]